MRSVKWCHF